MTKKSDTNSISKKKAVKKKTAKKSTEKVAKKAVKKSVNSKKIKKEAEPTPLSVSSVIERFNNEREHSNGKTQRKFLGGLMRLFTKGG